METLQFGLFTRVEYTGTLDVKSVQVMLDERLQHLIQKAQQFLQEHPKACYVAVPLDDDDYQVEFPEYADDEYYPSLVVLNIHRGYLTLELTDDYSLMESDRVYLDDQLLTS